MIGEISLKLRHGSVAVELRESYASLDWTATVVGLSLDVTSEDLMGKSALGETPSKALDNLAAMLATDKSTFPMSNSAREFRPRLAEGFRAMGCILVSAELGRQPDGQVVWTIVLRHEIRGVLVHKISFDSSTDPYTNDVADRILAKVGLPFEAK